FPLQCWRYPSWAVGRVTMPADHLFSRRHFLGAAGLASSSLLVPECFADEKPARLRVAAIYTVFTLRSHAHVILEKFLKPSLFNRQSIQPPVEIVSFYADQIAKQGDMTAEVAKQFKIPVHKTIEAALTLGGRNLAVDAVLSIGEHGIYPVSKLGQIEYPR